MPIGVVSVAHYNPAATDSSTIDADLRKNLSQITAKIKTKGNSIDITSVDTRDVDFDISFEIVDRTNHVLANNGRMPTFIDPSYVAAEMQQAGTFRVVKDTRTHERFLIISKSIIRSASPIGIIVIGKSLAPFESLIYSYTVSVVGIGIVGLPIISLLLSWLLFRSGKKSTSTNGLQQIPVKRVRFLVKESILEINGKKVEIPYATNQYELCKALFSGPNKRWELDELIEKFGEPTESSNIWRKVYDAALSLNKKVGFKLVEYKDKTFKLNTQLEIEK